MQPREDGVESKAGRGTGSLGDGLPKWSKTRLLIRRVLPLLHYAKGMLYFLARPSGEQFCADESGFLVQAEVDLSQNAVVVCG